MRFLVKNRSLEKPILAQNSLFCLFDENLSKYQFLAKKSTNIYQKKGVLPNF